MLTALFLILLLIMVISFFSDNGDKKPQAGAPEQEVFGLLVDTVFGYSRPADLYDVLDELKKELSLPKYWEFSGPFTYNYNYDRESGLTVMTVFETTHGLDREEQTEETKYYVCHTGSKMTKNKQIALLPADIWEAKRINPYDVKFSVKGYQRYAKGYEK